MRSVIGWDIGGAHLKGAKVVGGRVVAVDQRPFALWLAPAHLVEAMAAARDALGGADLEAATMTGELAECFASRAEGVAAIAGMLPPDALVYAGGQGFIAPMRAAAAWRHVASMNWRATAMWAARRLPSGGLLVDIGSTTTDLIPFAEGRSWARGTTDAARLESGELVYTGVARTSLQAVADHAFFGGARQRLMAENFAETADIYRLTGELAAEDDHFHASDGRSKSPADARARLARMLGRDTADASDETWYALAAWFRQRQLAQLHDASVQVLSGVSLADNAPLVACGAGAFLVAELAARLDRPVRPFSTLVPAERRVLHAASVAAPASSVALLADAL